MQPDVNSMETEGGRWKVEVALEQKVTDGNFSRIEVAPVPGCWFICQV